MSDLDYSQHEPVNPVTLPMIVPRRRLSYLRRGADGACPRCRR